MTLLKPQPKSITSALQHLTLHTYFFDVQGLVKAQLISELRVSSSSTLTQELHTQVTHLPAWELLSWNLSWQAKPLSFTQHSFTQTPQVCHRNQSTVSKEAPLTFRSRPRDAAERRNKTKKITPPPFPPKEKKIPKKGIKTSIKGLENYTQVAKWTLKFRKLGHGSGMQSITAARTPLQLWRGLRAQCSIQTQK